MTNTPSKLVNIGMAYGGPLAGLELQTDYPKGIVLVDRPKKCAWIYDWNTDSSTFIVRSADPAALEWRQSEEFNIRRAMEENNYEVRSHPRAGEDY